MEPLLVVDPDRHITAPWHTRAVFDIATFPDIVDWAAKILQRDRPDALVACGHSGLLLAGALSYRTRVPTLAVRKPSEEPVAGNVKRVSAVLHTPAERWVWIDDAVSSGGTLVRSAMECKRADLVVSPFPAYLILYKEHSSSNRAEKGSMLWSLYNDLKLQPPAIPAYGDL